MKKTIISVVIVSFNTKQLLKNCLSHLTTASKELALEIIVVDNNSTDGSWQTVKKEFPRVILVKNPANFFLHKAFNQGIQKAHGQFVLFLNSDTLPTEKTIRKSLRFLKSHSQVAAVSCKHIEQNGKVDKTCSRFPTPATEIAQSSIFFKLTRNAKILKRYKYSGWTRNSLKKVEVIPGSFMLIRKKVLETLGGFDENIKLFYGDTDLCVRIASLNLSLYHLPEKIVHLRSQSVRLLPKKQLGEIVQKDTLYYYKKHFGTAAALILQIVLLPNLIYWQFKKNQ